MSVSFEIRPAYVSKATTALQLLTVFLALMFTCLPGYINYAMIETFFWVTAFFTVVSGLNYVSRGIKFINNS